VRRLVIAVLVGAVIGGLLGYYGQCTTGMCPLTANPWRGATVGAILGLLFGLSSAAGAKAPAKPEEDDGRGLPKGRDGLCPGVAVGEDGSEPDSVATSATLHGSAATGGGRGLSEPNQTSTEKTDGQA
jgi:hypothetical protein